MLKIGMFFMRQQMTALRKKVQITGTVTVIRGGIGEHFERLDQYSDLTFWSVI